MTLTPEFRFVCACCRWPDDDARRSALAAAAGEVRDWDEVARLAREHRVEGLVAYGAGAAGIGGFAATADRVKLQALDDLAETVRLSRAFDGAGIRHAVLKGVPLGVRAFGSATLKQSWDIDLLVAPADAVAAAAVLTGMNYAPHMPARPFTRAEFRRWSVVSKEAEFRSTGGRTVELHWAVSDHPMLLAGVGVQHADQPVDLLEGATVPTLGDAANLAYLAVHGASHGWSRLKWLADFAGFLAAQPAEQRARLIDSARAFGTGRAIDQALILTQRLLGALLHPAAEDVEAAELAGLAAVVIDRRGRTGDFDRDPVASKAIREIRRRLEPGTRYRLILLHKALRGSEDRRLIPLPRGLGWAYWALRPMSAAVRALGRRLPQRRLRASMTAGRRSSTRKGGWF